MRRVRIVVGLAAAVCAFSVLAAPALAKKVEEKATFGKFTANIPGRTISPSEPAATKGVGSLTEINLAHNGLVVRECLKPIKSEGQVDSESSETFYQGVTFAKCLAEKVFNSNGGKEARKIGTFMLDFEFHSNKSAVLGEGAENELEIKKESALSIPVGKGACTVVVPAQTVPVKAAKKPNQEYEAVAYGTEKEPANIKKFPTGFQEKLNIELELTKIITYVKPMPPYCEPAGSPVEDPASPWNGYVRNNDGTIEMEIEEITIKHGNVGFEPATKV
jgi:hypothetical protein